MNFDGLTEILREPAQTAWADLVVNKPDVVELINQTPQVAESLPRVWGSSVFVRQFCCRHPERLASLISSNQLLEAADRLTLEKALALELDRVSEQPEAVIMSVLRRFRQTYMSAVAWRDLAGWASLAETLTSLSDLADLSVDAAVKIAQGQFQGRYGLPRSEAGDQQHLVVLAMGKLGGRELNFSSDIDLIFLFPESGNTDGKKSVANEQYFQRLSQLVIRLLDQVTEDGFVWRIDTRLRPFGGSGPLALSFSALENYLEAHGREWERYAYIKARPITGKAHDHNVLANLLQPFVYRRYLDYGVFEAIRNMKMSIVKEVQKRRASNNIKLGEGGIREIEFIAQTIQLIRGGSDKALQTRSLLQTLKELDAGGWLTSGHVAELTDAYVFLRRFENHLQAMEDKQTHDVPSTRQHQEALALSMDVPWNELLITLQSHRDTVSAHFNEIVVGPSETTLESHAVDSDVAVDIEQVIGNFEDSIHYRRLDKHGQRRMDALLPVVAGLAIEMESPLSALKRMIMVFESIGRRSSYFSLLLENRQVLQRLLDLCSHSSFLTQQVADHPLLLDELIDQKNQSHNFSARALKTRLERRFKGLDPDDLEAQMDALRHFQQANLFRIALGDLDDDVIAKVSDRLTLLAETVIDSVLKTAWKQGVDQYGKPRSNYDGDLRDSRFVVVGYGKLGGLELGYGSDLDLVFIHDSNQVHDQTTGPKQIDNGRFFARVSQRMMHLLQTPTAAGSLYQVDTRLRPSGQSGLLVSSLEAFNRYQETEAWTWEHQALLRARVVAGDQALAREFQHVRKTVLCKERDVDGLRDDVLSMRHRMLSEHKPSIGFHLKRDPGGMTDIEFIVQYLVLRWAHTYPDLVRVTDNLSLLVGLAQAKVLQLEQVEGLTQSYLTLRQKVHRLALDGQDPVVGEQAYQAERKLVSKIWGEVMGV